MNWNEAKILFKYVSRSRPQKFKEGLESIINNLARPDIANFLFTLDKDDDKIKEYDAVLDDVINTRKIVLTVAGESKSKIHACNRDMDIPLVPQWDILVLFSDDMFVVQNGFDNIIRQDMAAAFPNGDGFLHYNDGYQKENVCTLSIMDRKYFERDKYIYNPNFVGLWCDVQATEMAFMRGRYKYMGDDKIIVRHVHPKTGQVHPQTGQPAKMDKQYERDENMKRWGEDAIVLKAHREHFYGIPESERVNGFKYNLTEELIERERQYRRDYGNEFIYSYKEPMETKPEENEVQETRELIPNLEKTNAISKKISKKIAEAEALGKEMESLGVFKMKLTLEITPAK